MSEVDESMNFYAMSQAEQNAHIKANPAWAKNACVREWPETPVTGIVKVDHEPQNRMAGVMSKTDEDIYYAMSDREKATYIKANPDWPRSVGWMQTRWAVSEIEKIDLNDLVHYFEWVRCYPEEAARYGAAGVTMLGSDYKERKPITPIESVGQGSTVRNGLSGVGPDAPIVTNEQGGRQSSVEGRFDLLPPRSLIEIAKILEEGAIKYGESNWHLIEWRSHLNHVLQHVFALLYGDVQDDHMGHAACRMLMAHEMYLKKEA
jgi:hypothetical protein